MFGSITLFELRTAWKGLFILVLLIFILAAGMPQVFPSIKETNPVSIDVPDSVGGTITLSWKEQDDASEYIVGEITSFLDKVNIIYTGEETIYSFTKEYEGDRTYIVGAEVNSEFKIIGFASTSGESNPFAELIKNPVYAGFTGGRNIDMTTIKGYLSLEFFSWWWIIAGAFIAYMAVSMISGDFEGKRIDLVFSTPISRKRYIIEKFLTMFIISVVMILVATGGLLSGIESIGESSELSSSTIFMSILGCLPVLTLFASVGMLTAVIFKKMKIGVGITLAFIFGSYFVYTFGSLSKDLEWMKTISFMNYWDYNAVLYDGNFEILPFIWLFIVTIIIVALSIYIFENRDILI